MFKRKRRVNLSMKQAMCRNTNTISNKRNFKLKENDKGDKVRRLQEMLNDIVEFYPSIKELDEDGCYGKNTFESVKRFQELMGIYDTGIVDTVTWNKLQLIHSKKSAMKSNVKKDNELERKSNLSTRNDENLEVTLTPNLVEEIQENINKASNFYKGIPKVKIDGVYGEKTREAINIFKNMFELKSEEKINNEIIEKIKEASLGKRI